MTRKNDAGSFGGQALPPRIVVPPEPEPHEPDEPGGAPPEWPSEELRWLRGIAAVLIGVTAIVAFSNWKAVERRRVFDSPFRFEVRSVMSRPARYALHVDWREAPSETGGRPQLVLDGAPIPARDVAAPLLLEVGAGRADEPSIRRLGIRVAGDTAPGVYAGAIRFVPQQAPSAEAMAELAFPVSVVVPAWWQEWSVLVAWLATAAVVVACVYSFLLHWFPAPRGALTLRYLTEEGIVADDRLPFGWSLAGFLAPWQRSRVGIDRAAAKRSWGKSLALPRARIEFMRLGLLAARCSCVVAEDDGAEIRKLPSGVDPGRTLGKRDGFGVSGYEPVFTSDFESWFVLWTSDTSGRWVAFRCVGSTRT